MRLFLPFFIAAFLLCGCASTPKKPPLPLAEKAADFVVHQKVGCVAALGGAPQTAVVRLDEGVMRAPPPQTVLTARDLSMAPVAELAAEPVQQGRFFGVRCLSGEVRVGDRVYLPDPIPLSESDPMGATRPGNAGIGIAPSAAANPRE